MCGGGKVLKVSKVSKVSKVFKDLRDFRDFRDFCKKHREGGDPPRCRYSRVLTSLLHSNFYYLVAGLDHIDAGGDIDSGAGGSSGSVNHLTVDSGYAEGLALGAASPLS